MRPEGPAQWTRERHERLRERILLKVAQRQRRQAMAIRFGATLAVALVVAAIAHERPRIERAAPETLHVESEPRRTDRGKPLRETIPRSNEPPAPQTAQAAVVEIRPMGRSAELEEVTDQDARSVRLKRGGVRVRIEGATELPIRVLAGEYVIEHIGTTFSVSLQKDDALLVAVEEGSVRVSGKSVTRVLEAGQQLTLMKAATTPTASRVRARAADTISSTAAAQEVQATAPMRNASVDARAHVPSAPPALAADDDVTTLLLWVDAARAAGRTAEAIAHLDALLGAHPHDRRSEMAHFLRGKLLMEAGRHGEAIADFEAIVEGPLGAQAKVRAAKARLAAVDDSEEVRSGRQAP